MKISYVAIAFVSAVAAGNVLAQTPPLSYRDIVSEARRYERLEGSERVISNKILGKKVRLNLQKFGNGSPGFYVKYSDMIGFICAASSPKFSGGAVVSTITMHEEGADGASHFYTLDSCSASTK